MERTEHSSLSTRWNITREEDIKAIEEDRPHERAMPRDTDGWWRVSRHSASLNSAYKCVQTLRLKHPSLTFVVRKPVKRARWKGEIWAKKESS